MIRCNIMVLQLIGILVAFSYILVMLSAWILSTLFGYGYFAAGEQNDIIKYIEWILGVLAIWSLVRLIIQNINGIIKNLN